MRYVLSPLSMEMIDGFALFHDSVIQERPDFPLRFSSKIKRPGFKPEDFFIHAMRGTSFVGFAEIVPEIKIRRIVLNGFVSPSERRKGLGHSLLEMALGRSRSFGADVAHVCVSAENSTAVVFLENNGFAHIRTYFEMEASLTETAPGPPKRTGEIGVLHAGEESILAGLQNKIFEGSWGFCPNTPEEIRYYLGLTGASLEDVLIFRNGEEDIGYLWSFPLSSEAELPDPPKMRIHMFGILPEWRGRGLGLHLMRAGFERMKLKGAASAVLTVDERNTPAVDLYRNLGFNIISRSLWYEFRLDQ